MQDLEFPVQSRASTPAQAFQHALAEEGHAMKGVLRAFGFKSGLDAVSRAVDTCLCQKEFGFEWCAILRQCLQPRLETMNPESKT